jgi:retinol dehydrogenase 12
MAARKSDITLDGSRSNATEKIIMITGGRCPLVIFLPHLTEPGNSGIGKATFEALIGHNPTHVYMLCRNLKESMATIDKMQRRAPNVLMNFLACDLSSFESIRKAVSAFSLLTPRLDILICNAGIFMAPATLTEEGYERHFGINHLGHALLIKLLLPSLLRTAAVPPGDIRIIIVASAAHKWAPPGGICLTKLGTTQENLSYKQRYAQSKLANIIYAREMARRYPAIKTMSLDPGRVATNNMYHLQKKYLHSDRLVRCLTTVLHAVYRGFGGHLLTPEEGAQVPIWCASAPAEELKNGEYYDGVGTPGECTYLARDATLATDLWAWTQAIVTTIPFEENSTRE